MDVTQFGLRVLVLFIPGLISFTIVERLTIHKEVKNQHLLIYSFLLGVLSYFTYYIILYAISRWEEHTIQISFLQSVSGEAELIDFLEVGVVSLLAVPIGFVMSTLVNHKILFRFARKMRVTKRHGDIDVWSYLLNSDVPEWIIIRDFNLDLMYYGWVEVFSDSSDLKEELFLRDVAVYRNTSGKHLYDSPGIYLARSREHLVVEFPGVDYTSEIPPSVEDSES